MCKVGSVKGTYKIYQLLDDHQYVYVNIFGEKKIHSFFKGTKVYETINYHQGRRSHYFDKKTGFGGRQVGTIEEVENNKKLFKYIGTRTYE